MQYSWPDTLRKPGRGAILDGAHPLARGLVSYLLFDECAGVPFDLARRATWARVGSPVWAGAAGAVSPGLSFSGTGQYLTAGSAGPLAIASGTPLTLECWYMATATLPSQDGVLVGKYDTATLKGYCIAIDHLTSQPYVFVDSGTFAEAKAGTTTLNALYHLVGIVARSGSNYAPAVYVNGVNVTDAAQTTVASTLTDPGRAAIVAGCNNAATVDHLAAARIFQASIRTRAISAAEVVSLYRRPWQLLAAGPARAWYGPPAAAAVIHARRTLTPRAGSRGMA